MKNYWLFFLFTLNTAVYAEIGMDKTEPLTIGHGISIISCDYQGLQTVTDSFTGAEYQRHVFDSVQMFVAHAATYKETFVSVAADWISSPHGKNEAISTGLKSVFDNLILVSGGFFFESSYKTDPFKMDGSFGNDGSYVNFHELGTINNSELANDIDDRLAENIYDPDDFSTHFNGNFRMYLGTALIDPKIEAVDIWIDLHNETDRQLWVTAPLEDIFIGFYRDNETDQLSFKESELCKR